MKMLSRRTMYVLVGAAVLWGAPQVSAQGPVREKMNLSFSEPIRIPGKVLPAGEYVFKQLPSRSANNIVQVFDNTGTELIATIVTVPKRRQEPQGDVVLTFGAGAADAPPALKGYFYPGTLSGHELVYPEREAAELAKRHRTVVISHDITGSDYESATLRLINDRGERSDFVAHTSSADASEKPDATAPIVMANREGQRVELDALEENPSRYVGQRISVDAEVEEVYGPRLFTIDEANWGDLDGELLVFMPTALAALVAENDRVTISGTMRPFMEAEIEREWGWLDPTTPDIDVDVSSRPVLVADRLVGGKGDLAMKITTEAAPVGTSGTRSKPAEARAAVGTTGTLDSVADVVTASGEAIGRSVNLNGVTVSEVQQGGGFWVRDNQGNRAFVLPQDHGRATVSQGQRISVDGFMLAMPTRMRDRLNTVPGAKPDMYVFATSIDR